MLFCGRPAELGSGGVGPLLLNPNVPGGGGVRPLETGGVDGRW